MAVLQFDSHWWLSVLRWVDADDLSAANEKRKVQVALAFFLDMLVNRPTEFNALLPLFLQAWSRYNHRDKLTPRQQEALDLADEARVLGVNAAKYIADRLGITPNAAYKRLQKAKSYNFDDIFHVHSRESCHSYKPKEVVIKKRMASYQHRCPAYGAFSGCEGTISGNRDLCENCHRHYGQTWGVGDVDLRWLDMLIKDNRRMLRARAIDELLVTYTGDEEELDLLVAA